MAPASQQDFRRLSMRAWLLFSLAEIALLVLAWGLAVIDRWPSWFRHTGMGSLLVAAIVAYVILLLPITYYRYHTLPERFGAGRNPRWKPILMLPSVLFFRASTAFLAALTICSLACFSWPGISRFGLPLLGAAWLDYAFQRVLSDHYYLPGKPADESQYDQRLSTLQTEGQKWLKRSIDLRIFASGQLDYALSIWSRNPIVSLSERLLDLMEDRELRAIFAHEVAHLVNRDTRTRALFQTAFSLVGMVCIASMMALRLIPAANFWALIVTCMILLWIWSFLANVPVLWLIRSQERRANLWAIEKTGDGEALLSAVRKLAGDSPPKKAPLLEHLFFETHPTPDEIAAQLADFRRRNPPPAGATTMSDRADK